MANQANLYPDGYNNVSTKAALDWYKANGATPSKIVMGLPLYGSNAAITPYQPFLVR